MSAPDEICEHCRHMSFDPLGGQLLYCPHHEVSAVLESGGWLVTKGVPPEVFLESIQAAAATLLMDEIHQEGNC